ncbi:MAG: dTDP-4-dehydrorhamnose reductase [Gammaproteobacteria bacterium]|nr:dTDP-4-dehydrorhamnose reductase [Gammaproteobacteria bacterium]MBU1653383.1 dTDP-4-dehydrorhamnose reductase [Gammaproteobacteria bacterium]MBU1960836.1 dTDP-4-dehydrorhamnose reductase [Gammaproteobacteria bacterium]
MREMAKILLLGGSGQVGWELRRTLAPLGRVTVTTRETLDLSNLMAVQRFLETERPAIILNAAAYTAVDRAEQEEPDAVRLNAELPALLARWSAECAAPLIHFSTDYVFDGTKTEPYGEDDVPNPLNVYGRSKLAGDLALLDGAWAPFVFRVSWVYGARGRNFLLTLLRLMTERDALRIVDDQWGAPTWSRDIAQATAFVVYRLLREPGFADSAKGLYHLSPEGETTWFGFASAIREIAGLECRLEPIPSSEYPTPARRPTNSRMNADKLFHALGLRLPHWRDSLGACMESLT